MATPNRDLPGTTWTNHETWELYLWLCNEPDGWLKARKHAINGPEALRQYWEHESQIQKATPYVRNWLLNTFDRIDWQRLVNALLED